MSNHRKVYLEITNRCNLSCAFCPGTERAPRALTEEEFSFLARRVTPWAEYIFYHLMGEPTAHPLLPRFIGIATELGLRSIITTNGTLLAKRGEALIEAKPHKVSISLHAFEANPPGISFEEYIDSCLDFAKRASESGIITVLRLWNLDGKARGALHEKNDIIIRKLEDAFPRPWSEVRGSERLRERIFLEWGEKFDWPQIDGAVLQEKGFCYGLRDQIGVLADGTVVPCCLDRNGDIALGNLFEDTLESILASPGAQKLYNGFTERRCTEELCRRCMRASYY